MQNKNYSLLFALGLLIIIAVNVAAQPSNQGNIGLRVQIQANTSRQTPQTSFADVFKEGKFKTSGGITLTGRATVSAKAPAGGLPVKLTCKNPLLVDIPAKLVIPIGKTSVDFVIKTKVVKREENVLITFQLLDGAISKAQQFTLTIMPPLTIALTPKQIAKLRRATRDEVTVTLTNKQFRALKMRFPKAAKMKMRITPCKNKSGSPTAGAFIPGAPVVSAAITGFNNMGEPMAKVSDDCGS